MFRPQTSGPLPQDVRAFIDGLHDAAPPVAGLFRADTRVSVSRAPGRMDVMGGIADYSGSLVLQMPIAEAAIAGVQLDTDNRHVRLVSLGAVERSDAFDFSLDDLMADGAPLEYEAARAFFATEARHAWSAYLGGAFVVLMRERGARFDKGCRILLDSRVPEGKGVSSSAAIEVATMMAICAAYDIEVAPRELALLCQKVENLVVGAPCGIMDQLASVCGEQDQLLAILCQPAEVLGTVALPDDLRVWGIDSGIRHAVSGADYGSVRTAAFMGLEILRKAASVAAGDDDRWRGYLANVTPHEWMQWEGHVPERMPGSEFLQSIGDIADTVTQVDPARDYGVRAATAHPIDEHQRLRTFAELLLSQASPRRNELLGELMLQSHASYSLCGLGSAGTDELVAAVDTDDARQSGLYGGKITGGGSGGTVAVLGDAAARPAVDRIAAEYAGRYGHEPYIFHGSSPGAAGFGVLHLEPVN